MELVLLIQEYENVYGIIVDDFFKLPFLSTYDAIVHKKSFSSWLDFISSVIIVFGSWVGVTLAFYFLGLGLIIAIIIGFIVWILFLIIYIVIAYRIVYRKYTRPVINGVINFVCGEENNYESIETILSSSISDNNKNEILTEFIESSRIPIRIRNSAICAIWFLQQKTEQQNARCEDKLTSDITWSKIKCNHIVPIGPPDLRNAVIQKYHDDRRN